MIATSAGKNVFELTGQSTVLINDNLGDPNADYGKTSATLKKGEFCQCSAISLSDLEPIEHFFEIKGLR